MDPLPAPKFQQRPWRFARKRRRSTNEGGDNEGEIGFRKHLICPNPFVT